jgi:NAD(P)-dependent dehydrogenase (short-subunit alcohol dehydrogenase family)
MARGGEKKLSGKVALVTGGSRGIGKAIVVAYADAGAKVFTCARNQNDLDRVIAELSPLGKEIGGLTADVGRAEDVARVAGAAVARFGTIDVLVNNASVLGPREPIANYSAEAWDEVIRINLTGAFLMTRAVLPTMLARRSGSIINISSGVGRHGKARWGAYAVSKAGLENFTQVLADEVSAMGIRVNAVNPAATRTQMRAAAYPAEDPMTLPVPKEIMPIFIYLASDESVGMSGRSFDARDWLARNG